MINRRDFLKSLAVGAAALSVPEILMAKEATKNRRKRAIELKEGAIILFQGDSITDAGRNKSADVASRANNADSLGRGYPVLAAAKVLKEHAARQPKIYNRGISGNKVFQLQARWQQDCIDLKPDVLSILIGVNDFWHAYNKKYDGTVEIYENDYRKLLTQTMQALPDVQLIIGEPFAINGVKAVNDEWFPAFDAYRAVARKLADEFGAIFIPYQSIFDEASKSAPSKWWTGDGVHPTLAGAELMADAWAEALK